MRCVRVTSTNHKILKNYFIQKFFETNKKKLICGICMDNNTTGKMPIVINNFMVTSSYVCSTCFESGTSNNPLFVCTDLYRSKIITWLNVPLTEKDFDAIHQYRAIVTGNWNKIKLYNIGLQNLLCKQFVVNMNKLFV